MSQHDEASTAHLDLKRCTRRGRTTDKELESDQTVTDLIMSDSDSADNDDPDTNIKGKNLSMILNKHITPTLIMPLKRSRNIEQGP